MANIIKLKYGSGVPGSGQLATGEVGLDLTNKIIYAGNSAGTAIEMARNMGEGGTIGWDQIDPETIPPELNIIINGEIPEYVTLDALIAQVKTNADDIIALKAWEVIAKGEISKLQADVIANDTAITKNATDIGKLNTTQGEQDLLISGNTDKINELDGRVGTNEGKIGELEAAIEKDLTGLVMAGSYSALTNLIVSVKSTVPNGTFAEEEPLSKYLGEKYAGYYFVVSEAGTLQNTGTPARADGDKAFIGDWLVADGAHWLHFNFSQESTVWGTISGTLSDQDDLQGALDTKYDKDSTIACGNYTANP
jgi:hypothetical protein